VLSAATGEGRGEGIAQPFNPRVVGSSPTGPTNLQVSGLECLAEQAIGHLGSHIAHTIIRGGPASVDA
jgi:hypothetical protein